MNKIHENKSTWCVMETPNGLANKVFHTLGKKKKKKQIRNQKASTFGQNVGKCSPWANPDHLGELQKEANLILHNQNHCDSLRINFLPYARFEVLTAFIVPKPKSAAPD